MTTVKENTNLLINRAALALLAAYALTTVHHIYGGLVDNAPDRLFVPLILAPLIVIAMISLYMLRRSGSRAALTTFSIVALLWVLLLGLLHGAYAHTYKDIVFLLGGSPHLYYALNPSEVYPPNDAFFEVTGVLDLVAAAWVAYAALRLIQGWSRAVIGTQRRATIERLED